jgi:hypothetical protein
MSSFIQPINLQISPDSLNQGEQAIRQELALLPPVRFEQITSDAY